jgi:hypothetical protein
MRSKGAWAVGALVVVAVLVITGCVWSQQAAEEGWVNLFNGTDLTGWHFRHGETANWQVVEGAMKGGGGTSDIVTDAKMMAQQLHVEFNVPQNGNSGVYLQGRYEVQVADSAGREPNPGGCGGIYGKATPTSNPAKAAGEWQTFDITFTPAQLDAEGKKVGNVRITVILNGTKIHDNIEINGVTGGALDGNEGTPGPLMLQGDHSAIQYRNIRWRPIEAP